MVRSMMIYSDMPNLLWDHTLEIATYILNLVPSKSIPITLIELSNGRKPSLRHVRICGSLAHVLKEETNKSLHG